jgi:hypothetical protein
LAAVVALEVLVLQQLVHIALAVVMAVMVVVPING